MHICGATNRKLVIVIKTANNDQLWSLLGFRQFQTLNESDGIWLVSKGICYRFCASKQGKFHLKRRPNSFGHTVSEVGAYLEESINFSRFLCCCYWGILWWYWGEYVFGALGVFGQHCYESVNDHKFWEENRNEGVKQDGENRPRERIKRDENERVSVRRYRRREMKVFDWTNRKS